MLFALIHSATAHTVVTMLVLASLLVGVTCALSPGFPGAVLQAESPAPPSPVVADTDDAIAYYRFVLPRVTADEWQRAVAALGPDAPGTDAVATAIREYEREVDRLSTDIGQFCADRQLRRQLAEIAAAGGSAVEAQYAARACFDRLKGRTWPRADGAVDDTWRRLTVRIDPRDATASARADDAKAALIRSVYLRHVASPNSWSYTGEGVDLRNLIVTRGATQSGSVAFADIVVRIAGDSSSPQDERSEAAAARIEEILSSHEARSNALIAEYFRARRANAARLPAANENSLAFAESRHARTIGSAKPLSAALLDAIHQVSTALSQHAGPEACADWEDLAWSAVLPAAFQVELPTRALRWMESAGLGDPVIAECRTIHLQYLEERAAPRRQMMDSLFQAKRDSTAPLRPDSPKWRELERLSAVRRQLSTTAIDRMKQALGPDDSAKLEEFLSAIRREWDPARNWRNL